MISQEKLKPLNVLINKEMNKKPEELNELFFTEVLGWKKYFPAHITFGNSDWWWLDKEGKYVAEPDELPKLQLSLDLQEEYLIPVLIDKEFDVFSFTHEYSHWQCAMQEYSRFGSISATAKTKPLAQLTAGLKALGVIE